MRTQPRFHLARALAWSRRAALGAGAGDPDGAVADLELCLASGEIGVATIRLRDEFAALRDTPQGQALLERHSRRTAPAVSVSRPWAAG